MNALSDVTNLKNGHTRLTWRFKAIERHGSRKDFSITSYAQKLASALLTGGAM